MKDNEEETTVNMPIRSELKEKIYPVLEDNRLMAQFFINNFDLDLSKYPFDSEEEVLEMSTRFLNLLMDYTFADTIISDMENWINNTEIDDLEQKLSILKSLCRTYTSENNREGMNVEH